MTASKTFAALLAVAVLALVVSCGSGDKYVFDASEELPTYAYTEAIEHAGKRAVVCGEVLYVTQRAAGDDTYLSFGKSYPNQIFAVIVQERDRSSFPDNLLGAYEKKTVCASGVIELKGRAAQITVRTGDQIAVQE